MSPIFGLFLTSRLHGLPLSAKNLPVGSSGLPLQSQSLVSHLSLVGWMAEKHRCEATLLSSSPLHITRLPLSGGKRELLVGLWGLHTQVPDTL